MAPPAHLAKLPANSEVALSDRLKAFWKGRTPQQRILLGIGVAIALGAVGLCAHLIATPEMKPLLSGLDPADMKTIAAQLDAKKIPYTVGADGVSLSVPSDQLDGARLEVASHDTMHSGRMGFEIFDKANWGATEFDEKVNYQRAMEGELERTIATMHSVKSASVHLVMATDSVFLDRQRSAKASVTLRLKGDGMTRDEVKAVQRLVAGAVDQLKPQDVTVVDADADRTLSSVGPDAMAGDDDLELGLTKRLVATLAPVVGADRLHASVNVEYETSSTEESQEKYDPQSSVALSMQKSEELSTGGLGASGVPGTSSNVPSAKAAQSGAVTGPGPTQSSKSESASYGVNRLTRHTVAPAGGIRRLTAAIVVDDAIERHQDKGKVTETHVKRTPEQLKLITELAQAAIGFNATRGDVLSVQNLAFDQPLIPEPPVPTFSDKVQLQTSRFAALIRYGVLFVLFGLVYLLMIRPIQKRALASPYASGPVDVDPEAALPATSSGSLALPELAIAERASVLRKELTEFVQQDPEAGTTAVRAWLREGQA